MRSRFVLCCVLLLAACLIWIRGAAQSPSLQTSHAILYTSTAKYDSLAWLRGAERFPLGAMVMFREGSSSRSLVSGFAASADATASFDGTRVLFAGKRNTGDRWQIWEVSASGGKARQITSCSENCVRPFYLPGDRLVYAHEISGRYIIESAALDGNATLQLTYAPSNALPTDVLRDGRVLFEAAYPLGSGSTAELYTVYADGSGVEAYRCDHGASRSAGKELSSGDIIFAKDNTPARFTSALAHDVPMANRTGQFAGDAVELGDAEWLVSTRPDAHSKYSLQLRNLSSGSDTAFISDPNADFVQAVLLAPHTVPKIHPSGLHDWPNANLLCLNAYTSKFDFANASIASVRLYTRAVNGKPKLLGSALVEADGSFFVQVPSDQPLQFELLDNAGKTLKRESGWWWARRGEQRVCVGCHAGPERAPDNAVPAVLLKSTEPVALLGTQPHASKGGR